MGRRRSAERPHREAARSGGREARAALKAERSNDESAGEKTFPRSSAAARSAFCTAARSLAAAARRGICGQDICGGYQASRRLARSNRGAQAPLGVGKTAGERHAAGGLRKPQKARGVRSGSASFAENRRRKGAAPHRRRAARARRTPRRYTNRRRHAIPRAARYRRRANTFNGRTPKAPARRNGDAGTRNPLRPLEHASRDKPSLQTLALAAERYTESRSRNAGEAFRGAADTAARPRRAAAQISQEQDFCGAYPEFVSAAPRRIGSVPIRFCAVAGIGKPTAVPMHLSEATI